jgi:hypothetical protein
MTTERDQDDRDELVSNTYRELGAPKTPLHLDQTILRMASDDDRRSGLRNTLTLAWMKPVAWAATIGLSLAIVLELTEVPTAAVLPDNPPSAQSVREDFKPQDADAMDKLENQARMQSDLTRQTISEDEAGRTPNAHENRSKSVQPATEAVFEEAVADEVEILIPEAKSPVGVMAAPAPAMDLPAADLSAARKRSADRTTVGETAEFSALSLERLESDVADSCDSATRQTIASWTSCIEDLRRAGENAAADREYEALILEFPLESADSETNK